MKFVLRIIVIMMTLSIQISFASAVTLKFKDCSEINKIYPGGVAKPGAVNKGGITKYSPKIDLNLYLANAKSDRDNDGIACER